MEPKIRPDRPLNHTRELIEESRRSLHGYVERSGTLIADQTRLTRDSRRLVADSWKLLAEYRERHEAPRSQEEGLRPSATGKWAEWRMQLAELPTSDLATGALAAHADEITWATWGPLGREEQTTIRRWLIDEYLALPPMLLLDTLHITARRSEVAYGALRAAKRRAPPERT